MSAAHASRLDWGIKRSFIEYVSGLDDGEIAATQPAAVQEPGLFSFAAEPDSSLDEATRRGVLRFRGTAHVSGHFGMMSVTITDPWIEIDEEGAWLTIPDPDRDPATGARLQLAELRLDASDTASWGAVSATLAPEAIGIFNGQYESGTPLDALTVVFTRV